MAVFQGVISIGLIWPSKIRIRKKGNPKADEYIAKFLVHNKLWYRIFLPQPVGSLIFFHFINNV